MPKQTTEVVFNRPAARVWKVVTDPRWWVWPGGPEWIHESRDGRQIVTEDKNGRETIFRITAFAPCRWSAAEVENQEAAGKCEILLFPEGRGGTRVEFTADIEGRTLRRKLLLRLGLRRWQERYIEALKRILRM